MHALLYRQPRYLSSDPALAGWQASPLGQFSNWDASSGAAAYNGGGHTQLYAGSGSWTDYRFAVKFRVDVAEDYPHPGQRRHDQHGRVPHLSLSFKGSAIKVSYDGSAVIETTDSAP